MPKVDHMFLFGENDKRMLKGHKWKSSSLGNTKNNHFIIKDRKVLRKINSILFISSAYYESSIKTR